MLYFQVSQARLVVSAQNFMIVLFLTYDVVDSWTRSRARGGMWRHASIPTTGWGTKSVTWSTTCLRQRAIRQRGQVHQVLRHRCHHGLERNTSPPSRSCRYVTRRRLTPHFVHAPLATRQIMACASPRMTWCCTRHLPLKFRTTVPLPKGLSFAMCINLCVSTVIYNLWLQLCGGTCVHRLSCVVGG